MMESSSIPISIIQHLRRMSRSILSFEPKLQMACVCIHKDIQCNAKYVCSMPAKTTSHLETSIDERMMDLVHLIEQHYLSTDGAYRVMDWAHVAQYFTMDVRLPLPSRDPWAT
jgi:hypothetical protein